MLPTTRNTRQASDDSRPTTSFFVNSRTLIRRRVGAPHQCPLGSVASNLIYADVRTLQ